MNKKEMTKLTNVEKGWLAAAIDGKGYLYFAPRRKRTKNGWKKDGWTAILQILGWGV